ncbi:response regulator [Tolumonas lignilytica]|jgi:Response regulator containing CheY-like receiver, AAA-type ATPase, and DNA-binding domains|uniref:response regulator n=1 Tax=Tolumonas lignilytica TaxID=1283284 RepID=UPI0004636094|nr:response regulator [Tolumonas lignilytica]
MERILLVDDEPMILKALVRLLQRTPCLCDGRLFKLEMVTFTDPVKALDYARENQISLVISDYRMPGMDGVNLLTSIKTLQPNASRIIISGYADLNALIEAINRANIYRFIAKPWNDYELTSTVGQALRHRQLMLENQLLADQRRVALGKLSGNDLMLKRLELEEPGITNVNWGPDGSVILDDEE